MQKVLLLLILLLVNITTNAQKALTGNFFISYTQEYYFNKVNTTYDRGAETKENDLAPKNTWGNNAALSYQVIYKHRFIAEIGIGLGQQKDNVDVSIDLSHLDPDTPFPGAVFQANITHTTTYVSPRLVVGYQFHKIKKWPVNIKAGVRLDHFTNSLNNQNIMSIAYSRDNKPDTSVTFRYTYLSFGRNHGNQYPTQTYSLTNIFSVGTAKEFNRRWFNSISIDLEGTFALGGYGLTVIEEAYKNQAGGPWSDLDYHQRNLALGLRIGVGIFK